MCKIMGYLLSSMQCVFGRFVNALRQPIAQ